MPQFTPGTSHVAGIPVTVKPASQSCAAYVLLTSDAGGANIVWMSSPVAFTSIGSLANVSVPVVAPANPGSYFVFVAIAINGIIVGAWPQENLNVAAPVSWQYSNLQVGWGNIPPSQWGWAKFSVLITNPGNLPATKTVQAFWQQYFQGFERADAFVGWGPVEPANSASLTLSPGQSATFGLPNYPDVYVSGKIGYTFDLWVQDSDGNQSDKIEVVMGRGGYPL